MHEFHEFMQRRMYRRVDFVAVTLHLATAWGWMLSLIIRLRYQNEIGDLRM